MEKNKNIVYVPEESVTVNFEVTEEKPFNACFQCPSFRNGCSGPNIAILSPLRACEFLQMTRVFLGYSYQYIADGTNLSLATVKRNLNGEISDPSFYTLSVLSRFLCGDPNGKYPCAIPNIASSPENDMRLNDALRDLERALGEKSEYKSIIDNIHFSYKEELEAFRVEHQKDIDRLHVAHQKDIDHLHKELERALADVDRARAEAEHWRHENDRKGRLIDKYMEKIVAG